jgi:hypothetical protein
MIANLLIPFPTGVLKPRPTKTQDPVISRSPLFAPTRPITQNARLPESARNLYYEQDPIQCNIHCALASSYRRTRRIAFEGATRDIRFRSALRAPPSSIRLERLPACGGRVAISRNFIRRVQLESIPRAAEGITQVVVPLAYHPNCANYYLPGYKYALGSPG